MGRLLEYDRSAGEPVEHVADEVEGTGVSRTHDDVFGVGHDVVLPDAERQFAQRMGVETIEVATGPCAMVSHPVDGGRSKGRSTDNNRGPKCALVAPFCVKTRLGAES
ncbi:MAG: hypothetical protein ACRDQD_02390 [Nocardioidaceae bacterium]